MFDVAPTELIVLGTVALLVIPPKDLPRAMRMAGYWVGRARGVARQFRSGFDTMVRDAELAEMENRWKAENERIMREHPATRAEPDAASEQGSHGTAAPVVTVERPELVGPGSHDEPATRHPLSVEAPIVEPAAPATPPDADTKASS